MGLTNYAEDAILNELLRGVNFTPPTTVYLALFTAAPGETGGGTEVSGVGYARVAVTFGAPSAGVIANDAEIAFPVATADWGTVTHAGVFDAATGGNLLIYGALTTAKAIVAGDQPRFRANDIQFTLD